MGVITAFVAQSKGRNALGWFFIGFLFSCIGLIVVCIMPDLEEEKARWRNADRERRLLKEKLRQEQMKNSVYQSQVNDRLDAHDQALNMNTAELGSGTVQAMLSEDPREDVECPGCGRSLLPKCVRCIYCGTNLQSE
jgi:hypothetical protein